VLPPRDAGGVEPMPRVQPVIKKAEKIKRFKTMKRSIFIRAFAALVACALVLPVVGGSKNPVERPFKAAGIFTSDPVTETFLVLGNATHLGKIVFAGDYSVVDFAPNEFGYLVTLNLHGIYTAANGDTINIDCKEWVTQYRPDDSSVWSTGSVDIIGGTGRFAGATGSYVGNILGGDPLTFTAEGTITY
jgi:hypothetical protein